MRVWGKTPPKPNVSSRDLASRCRQAEGTQRAANFSQETAGEVWGGVSSTFSFLFEGCFSQEKSKLRKKIDLLAP